MKKLKIKTTLMFNLIFSAILLVSSFTLGAVGNELTIDQILLSGHDMEITRQLRRDLIKNKDLSLYAHNVKIIASNGKVILRGPVRSKNEIKTIIKSAGAVAGDSNVINEMIIVPKQKK